MSTIKFPVSIDIHNRLVDDNGDVLAIEVKPDTLKTLLHIFKERVDEPELISLPSRFSRNS